MKKRLFALCVAVFASLSVHAFDVGHLLAKSVLHIASGNGAHAYHSGSSHATGEIPLLPAATGSFADCRDEFAQGQAPRLPANMASGKPLCFNGFAVLYSPKTKTPIYSAEVLTRQRVQAAMGEPRTNNFFEDPRLAATDRASLQDFRGSGLDRGHMTPAADAANATEMSQTFSLANMVPQAPENNRKAWADIEKATRKFALRAGGNVYVITGPYFQPGYCPTATGVQNVKMNDKACTIGNGVAVPSHLFKLVYDQAQGRAWAHWLENVDGVHVGKPISYQELVQRTGVEWLPGVQLKSESQHAHSTN